MLGSKLRYALWLLGTIGVTCFVTVACSPAGSATSTMPVTTAADSSTAAANTDTGGAASTSTNDGESTSSGGGMGATGGEVFPPSVIAPRIMIVGDSISAGPGCYKKYLVQQLTENQISNYEFVGEYDDDCGGGVRHSAVSCTTTADYVKPTFTVPNCFNSTAFPGMSSLVQTYDPDLILLQLGVNDVWSGNAAIQPILDNYASLVEQARTHNPNIVVMVAQIHKIITDNCQNAASTTNAEQLVMAVPGWAQTLTTDASPVLVADLWTNSDPNDANDCVHPNDAGARRMGLNWYNALESILP
jgi:hypothetical protein